MAKKVIYRLKSERNPLTWGLKVSKAMAEKPGKGMKFINYYEGQDSIFDEDITNKDIKPSEVPHFELNVLTGKTELSVDASNKNLIDYLDSHSWANKKYFKFSKEAETTKKLSHFDDVDKALEYIRESDPFKIQAMTMVVFGNNTFGTDPDTCKLKLKEKAMESPKVINDAFEDPNYENKYTAGLAFATGIIRDNMSRTAVEWADSGEIIVHLAQGEKGIDKISGLLSKGTEEANILIQEFYNRIEERDSKPSIKETSSKELAAKDKEIEILKAKLAKQSNSNVQGPDKAVATKSVAKDSDEKSDEPEELTEAQIISLLKKASQEYLEKFGKEVPPNMRKNLSWIENKVAQPIDDKI